MTDTATVTQVTTEDRASAVATDVLAAPDRSALHAALVAGERPQRPGPLYGHGRSTRAGDASSTSTASARQKPGCRSSVTRTTTRSPGSVCRTKTTRPSCRATQ